MKEDIPTDVFGKYIVIVLTIPIIGVYELTMSMDDGEISMVQLINSVMAKYDCSELTAKTAVYAATNCDCLSVDSESMRIYKNPDFRITSDVEELYRSSIVKILKIIYSDGGKYAQ